MKTALRILLLCSLLAIAMIVATATPCATAGGGHGNPNPGIIPPNAHYRGFTYGEWQAMWWQAAFDIPVVDGEHPLISGGAFQGPKGMVFLAGVFADPEGPPAEAEITIPAGTPLFFPIINSECSVFEPDPFHGDDEDELRDCANDHIDNTSDIFAFIDGRRVRRLDAYRTESPLFVWGPLPEDNIFAFFGLDAPEGTTSPAVDAGFYLLLKPLSVGTHVIEFGGTFNENGSINTRYLVHVVPHRR